MKGCRELVWVDAAPLLKAEQARLRSTKKKLSVAEERLRLHQQSDEPDYQRWFNQTFAVRLAGLRELYEKLAELDAIVWKVEREILATGASATEAYQTVLEEMREEGANADGGGSDDEVENEDAADGPDAHESGGDNDDRARNSDDGDDGSGDGFKRRTARTAPSKKAKAVDDLIKQIYRQLVRKLHPDLNPDLADHLKERWFDVQQAYEDRDLSRLEMLLASCEDEDLTQDDESFIDKIQSLSRLRLLLKSVAKKLRASRRQLAKMKTKPAWEFHKKRKDPRKLAILERGVRFELSGAEDSLESDIRTLEAQIKRWQEPPRRRNKRDWNLSFDF